MPSLLSYLLEDFEPPLLLIFFIPVVRSSRCVRARSKFPSWGRMGTKQPGPHARPRCQADEAP